MLIMMFPLDLLPVLSIREMQATACTPSRHRKVSQGESRLGARHRATCAKSKPDLSGFEIRHHCDRPPLQECPNGY